MNKLRLIPEDSSYVVSKGSSVLRTALDGGASRYRRTQLGATSTVDVVFQLDGNKYNYLEAFFRTATARGSLPFLIDLIIGYKDLKEYKAYFTPESLKLTGQKGYTYFCSAQLEVYPDADNMEYDNALMFFVDNYGFDWQFYEDRFDNIINVQFPQDTKNT